MKDRGVITGRPAPFSAIAEDVLDTYQQVASGFARQRDRTLFERRWLDRALGFAPGRSVLDLGCGTGQPISTYLYDRRCRITGVDGAAAMVDLFEKNLPHARALHADMRGLDLGERFDLILAWNSVFHLSADDQRAIFATFAAHARPRTVLMFTTGSGAGEAVGEVGGAPIYHASLATAEYADLLEAAGFEELAFVPEDPDCNGHTVWIARYRGDV